MPFYNMRAALKHLAEGGAPAVEDDGICIIFDYCEVSFIEELDRAMQQWPEYAGVKAFPVPCKGHSPSDAYFSTMNLWEGGYGDTRRRLCGWLTLNMEELEDVWIFEHGDSRQASWLEQFRVK